MNYYNLIYSHQNPVSHTVTFSLQKYLRNCALCFS